ncbi:hypothetical protein [Prosthecobacter dejongeii]|uniref:ABC-2 family transporter protein n=1 Tax=Prosthecobacter dejongeii TaxID=48465 RepID=A0A7W7YH14_9BACT|nr:hypothetical protein [Prosthecobacter dejongeii]MBB5035969.1 hypothetical protein [Prosthecobacter dejongeii]
MNAMRLGLLNDFGDGLSPMVVKELRHGLRTRMFTAVLTVFQFGMIMIVGSGALGVEAETISALFWGFSLAALLGALPLRGFGTLSSELSGGTLDMLTLTSISSLRIVFGKWSALFCQSLLLAVSLMPYMVVRYYFGGVEIVQEGVALLFAVLASGVATAAYVAFSSQRSIILRLFLGAGVLVSLGPVTGFIFMLVNENGGDQALEEFLKLSLGEQAGLGMGILVFAAYTVFTFLTLGASRIASLSENHSTLKRLIHLGMLTLITVVGMGLSFSSNPDMMFWAFVPSLFLTLLIGVDVLTEEMPRFPSVLQGSVNRGNFSKKLGRLLYPGWASAVLFYTLLGCLNFSMLMCYVTRPGSSGMDDFCRFVACVLLSSVVPVCVSINRKNRFANWCVLHIALGVAGFLLVMLVELSDAKELAFLGVVTPVTGLIASVDNYANDEAIQGMAILFGLCWWMRALHMAVKEHQVYRSLEDDACVQESSKASPAA